MLPGHAEGNTAVNAALPGLLWLKTLPAAPGGTIRGDHRWPVLPKFMLPHLPGNTGKETEPFKLPLLEVGEDRVRCWLLPKGKFCADDGAAGIVVRGTSTDAPRPNFGLPRAWLAPPLKRQTLEPCRWPAGSLTIRGRPPREDRCSCPGEEAST